MKEDMFKIMCEQRRMFGHLPKEMRTIENDGVGYFKKCEWCGYDCSEYIQNKSIFLSNEYRYAYDLILCDRCTDKFNSVANDEDIDDYWKDEDADRDNLPRFNYDIPDINQERIKELRQYKLKKYKEIHEK